MTRDEIRTCVLRNLAEAAPEADYGRLDPGYDLREQLDIDSMDFLRVLTGLQRDVGVEIPEADYAKVATLDQLVGYLETRCPR